MTCSPRFEIDGGFGVSRLSGTRDTSGTLFSVPLLYHLNDHFGIEYRPAGSSIRSNTIHDNDLAVILGTRYASIRLGYRWLKTGDERIDGPTFGVTLRW